MPKAIYALLVGIDLYPSPIPRLYGCVNDIQAFKGYLEGRVAGSNDVVLDSIELLNEQATRAAVIVGFRKVLSRAKLGDVALFYYSGHGSQEQAPEQFWKLEPDRLDETLVLYDSRSKDNWDLADKELAKLIDEVAANGAHVCVILDCCHSGSGTREVGTVVRRAPTDLRQRPIGSFLVTASEAEARSAGRDVSGWGLPEGRHVLFAACRSDEEAKEYFGDGKHRGAFSFFLGQGLHVAAGVPTYRDLFARTSSMVSAQVKNQSPQLELTRQDDRDAVFLDGLLRPAPATYTARHDAGEWEIDGGAALGIPPASVDDTTRLMIFPFDAPAEDLADPTKAVATARVASVRSTSSRITIDDGKELATTETFKAVITSLPTPLVAVRLEGDGAARRLVRAALVGATPGEKPSPFVREAVDGEVPRFRLIARDGRFIITRPEDERPLVATIEDLNPAGARLAVKRLEHMARWTQALELSNPASTIRPSDVKLTFLVDGKEVVGTDIRLEYRADARGRSTAPAFTLSMTNTTDRELYCGLLDLTQRYMISAELLKAGCQKLNPGEIVWASQGQPIPATVPDEVSKEGVVEYKDWLKLIVCTREFDATLLELPTLDLEPTRRAGTRSIPRNGSLNRLMEKIATRELGNQPIAEIDDWQAWGVCVTTVRPLAKTPLAAPGSKATLAAGVTVAGLPGLEGEARLTTATLSTRDLDNITLPRMLYDEPGVVAPWAFTASRGTDAGLSVLELSEINDYSVVTPENPLRVEVPLAIGADEHVLPVAFDGEFYLPLGGVARRDSTSTVVEIVRLPPPLSDRRSLTGAIKIFFQKVVGGAVGVDSPYPILGVAVVAADGKVEAIRDPAEVRARVSRASRVALFVHGIIGETATMVPAVRLARVADDVPIASLYDVILTFDYENLNTTIEENGRLLKQRLADCGLSAGNGRVLDVVAHSMGGLVSRWFIEQEGGHQVVRRLVMLGTPNDGSPWPSVANWATTAIALGLNQLTAIPWPSVVLGALQKSAESPTKTLNEMVRGSKVLEALSGAGDPGIPYVMLAGVTSLIPSATQEAGPGAGSRLGRLLSRLTSPNFLHDVADPFFMGQDNDIAVSLESMRNVPKGRKLAYDVRPVACDHVSYFRDPEGLNALAEVLSRGF